MSDEQAGIILAVVSKLAAEIEAHPRKAREIIHSEREHWSALAGAPRFQVHQEAA